ncbi:hypothetical protein C8Q76DRAFT_798066 [Earliella scabrosa]|nr:hypothetical protein C8Q76DRAFT_798066 [Earliella scabrosa]
MSSSPSACAFSNACVGFAPDPQFQGPASEKLDWVGACVAIVEVVNAGLWGIVVRCASPDESHAGSGVERRMPAISTVLEDCMAIECSQRLLTVTVADSSLCNYGQFHLRFGTPAEWTQFITAWMASHTASSAFRARIKHSLGDTMEALRVESPADGAAGNV